jgi:hypothetical protein
MEDDVVMIRHVGCVKAENPTNRVTANMEFVPPPKHTAYINFKEPQVRHRAYGTPRFSFLLRDDEFMYFSSTDCPGGLVKKLKAPIIHSKVHHRYQPALYCPPLTVWLPFDQPKFVRISSHRFTSQESLEYGCQWLRIPEETKALGSLTSVVVLITLVTKQCLLRLNITEVKSQQDGGEQENHTNGRLNEHQRIPSG